MEFWWQLVAESLRVRLELLSRRGAGRLKAAIAYRAGDRLLAEEPGYAAGALGALSWRSPEKTSPAGAPWCRYAATTDPAQRSG